MKLKIFNIHVAMFLIGLIVYVPHVFAEYKILVDVFGTKKITAPEVSEKFGKEISEVADLMSAIARTKTLEDGTSCEVRLVRAKEKLSGAIKSTYNFLYVSVSSMTYTSTSHVTESLPSYICITIDVVEHNDKHRLTFFHPQPTEDILDLDHMLESWRKYEHVAWSIDIRDIEQILNSTCPAYYCEYGFNHPQLAAYATLFDELAAKHRTQLVTILTRDKDEIKRGDAALILAHMKDGQELAKILLPSMRDSKLYVRYSVMHILSNVLKKVDLADFPVGEAITALDFPTTFDRDSGLDVLLSLAKNKKHAQYIALHAGKKLVDLLQMSQRNIHNKSYNLLKIVSGQNYGEHDYAAWQSWLDKR